jgi:hypothetical protein
MFPGGRIFMIIIRENQKVMNKIMPFVEIYKLQNDGSQKIIATCRLVGDVVECEGDGVFVNNLSKEGIYNYSAPEKSMLFPKDGMKFLEQLGL